MNSDRAAKLKQMSEDVRIGGKGSARRKRKVVHRTAASDDKKLQASLKKLMMNNIPGIEEVNMIRDDGHVIHFNNPKVQASLAANTFAITGHAETKLVTEILPQIINQLGPDSLRHLYQGGRKDGGDLNGHPDTIAEDDEDVPELVDNFDAPSKNESKVGDAEDDVPPLVAVETPAAEFVPPAAEVASPAPEPEVAVAPEADAAPEVVAAAPEADAAPEVVAAAPEVVAAPEAIPEVAAAPVAAPEVAAVPEAAPEVAAAPEAAPEVAAAPEAAPEVAAAPEAAPEADAAVEVAAAPAVDEAPEVVAAPVATEDEPACCGSCPGDQPE